MSRNSRGIEKITRKANEKKTPCNFTLVDIQASFGHVAHPSLGLLGGEGVEVVDKRRLVGDLKVPDAAVTLTGGKTNCVSNV